MQRPAAAEESAPTRTTLLDAAERLLARTGYRKMTMEDIAQEAGLSRRTVYGYFRGKDEVVLGTIDRIVERVSERLDEVARSGEGAAERLRDMLVERVRVRVESVRDYAHALDEIFATLRPAYLERRKAYFEEEAGRLVGVLREGQQSGVFERRDAQEVARLLLTATNAFLPHGLSPAQLLDAGTTLRQLEALAEFLVRGLRPVSPQPTQTKRTQRRSS
jgi:AcrR family transcriptional regulator